MFLFTCNKHAFPRYFVATVCAATFSPAVFAEVIYDVRAQTGDNIRALVKPANQPRVVYKIRKQGSFGAPAINDNGVVAYPCTMSGSGLNAFTNTGLILKDAKRAPRLGLQSGYRLNNNFMPTPDGNRYAVKETARIFQLGQNVGINKQGRMAFSGRLLYVIANLNDDGNVTSTTDAETAVYGTIVPSGNKFKNSCVSNYQSYNSEILRRPVSFNAQGAIAYNANFRVSSETWVEGFAYGTIKTQNEGGGVIATVDSNVIGLPYFTTFTTFGESIISDRNVGWTVAGLSDGGTDFDGIWQGNNPNVQPVVVKTSSAPGGGKFTSFGEIPGPSRNGSYCAFIGTATGGTVSTGVFRATKKGDDVRLVAKLDAPAPGLNGAKSSGNFTRFESAVSSNLGHVAIVATTTVNGTQRKGIWRSDREGKGVTMLVSTGQTITIRKKVKTITGLMVNPIGCINRNGDVVFTASFSDRTSAVIIAKAGL